MGQRRNLFFPFVISDQIQFSSIANANHSVIDNCTHPSIFDFRNGSGCRKHNIHFPIEIIIKIQYFAISHKHVIDTHSVSAACDWCAAMPVQNEWVNRPSVIRPYCRQAEGRGRERKHIGFVDEMMKSNNGKNRIRLHKLIIECYFITILTYQRTELQLCQYDHD